MSRRLIYTDRYGRAGATASLERDLSMRAAHQRMGYHPQWRHLADGRVATAVRVVTVNGIGAPSS
jgi:hypothetical protein